MSDFIYTFEVRKNGEWKPRNLFTFGNLYASCNVRTPNAENIRKDIASTDKVPLEDVRVIKWARVGED